MTVPGPMQDSYRRRAAPVGTRRRGVWRARCAAFSVAFVTLACGGPSPEPDWVDWFPYGRTVRSIPTTEKIAALTFDDGPNEPYTGQILDILSETGTKATFFLVGASAVQFPGTVQRIIREGHVAGNHTQSHARLSVVTPEQVGVEIERGADVIEVLTGERPRLMRPPYGDRGDARALRRTCRTLKCLVVTWSVNGSDYGASPRADAIVDAVLGQVERARRDHPVARW